MVIEFPNVCLRWHNAKKGICGVKDWVKDVSDKRYGYDLQDGATVYEVTYWQMTDDRHDMKGLYVYHAEIEKVTPEGVVISDWHMRGSSFDDHFREAGLMQDDGKIFAPWQLFDGDFILSIEPCDCLHDNYKVKQLLDGSAPLSNGKYVGDRYIPDPYGEGWWYRHGGWRTKVSRYAENLKNFIRLGQLELEI